MGLGNPGSNYAKTRHNVGFMVVDALAKEMGLKLSDHKKYHALFAKTDTVELIQPQTFMNKSGIAVSAIAKKHHIAPANILIVADDIDMELGKLRYRSEGSSGGHKGVQSIIDALETDQFARLKIGIGRPPVGIEPDTYVTQKFTHEQLKTIQAQIPEAIKMITDKFLS